MIPRTIPELLHSKLFDPISPIMNEIKAGAVVNYLNLIVRIGIGFLLSPFILYHLGVGEYGIYTVAGAIVGWLALADMGLGASFAKFLSEYVACKRDDVEATYLQALNAQLPNELADVAESHRRLSTDITVLQERARHLDEIQRHYTKCNGRCYGTILQQTHYTPFILTIHHG